MDTGVELLSVISKAKFASSELVTKLGNSVTSGPSSVVNDKPISSSESDIVVSEFLLVVSWKGISAEKSSSGSSELLSKLEGVGRSLVVGMVNATSGWVSSEVVLKLGVSISVGPTLSSSELSTSSKVSDTS